MNSKTHHHHMDGHSEKHDLHAVITPTHEAFSELVKEAVKERISKNTLVNEQIQKLADTGFSLIEKHITKITEEILADFAQKSKQLHG